MTGLPARNVVIAAVATPVGADYRPDGELLLARCRQLLAEGCDGITLFGTTGEGAEFAVADRQKILEQVIAGGLDPPAADRLRRRADAAGHDRARRARDGSRAWPACC